MAINGINPGLQGSVHIFSDCLGALDNVKNLPPSRVPFGLAHSDVLKNIHVNCNRLSFERLCSHVQDHQDDKVDYKDLSRPSQLNVNMNFYTKQALMDLQPTNLPCQQAFPLEPVCIFAESSKITADMGHHMRYLAHRCLAKDSFHHLGFLHSQEFNKVDWEIRCFMKSHGYFSSGHASR